MLISVKLLSKCIIIIFALGLVDGKFSIWIKVITKSIEILGWARWEEWLSHSKLKQAFLIDSDTVLFLHLIPCTSLGLAHEKFGIWTGPHIMVTNLSTTLFWQPVLWLWRWLTYRLPKHQSVQQQSYYIQDNTHPNDHIPPTYIYEMTPGFKPFTSREHY